MADSVAPAAGSPSEPAAPKKTAAAGATPPPAATPKPTPGFFNKGQLADIQSAEDILPPAATDAAKAAFLKAKLPAGYVDGLKQMVKDARATSTKTGQAKVAKHTAAVNATGTELALIVALQEIQAAAVMKKKFLEEDGDPATSFSTDGYLINLRLNPNRRGLLQNADTLRTRAAEDDIGFDAAELAAVDDAIANYTNDKAAQNNAGLSSDEEKKARDAFITRLNLRRTVLMLAIERLYPYSNHMNDPIRKAFGLPLDRAFRG